MVAEAEAVFTTDAEGSLFQLVVVVVVGSVSGSILTVILQRRCRCVTIHIHSPQISCQRRFNTNFVIASPKWSRQTTSTIVLLLRQPDYNLALFTLTRSPLTHRLYKWGRGVVFS